MADDNKIPAFLQGLLDQLDRITIDLPALIADPEFPGAAIKLIGLILKHAHPKV